MEILREHARNWQPDRIIPTVIFSMIVPGMTVLLTIWGGYLLNWRTSQNDEGGESDDKDPGLSTRN